MIREFFGRFLPQNQSNRPVEPQIEMPEFGTEEEALENGAKALYLLRELTDPDHGDRSVTFEEFMAEIRPSLEFRYITVDGEGIRVRFFKPNPAKVGKPTIAGQSVFPTLASADSFASDKPGLLELQKKLADRGVYVEVR